MKENKHIPGRRFQVVMKSAFLLAFSAILLAGCWTDISGSDSGDSLGFKVRTGVQMKTKTEYSGDTQEQDGVMIERMNWKQGDRIRIASDKASSRYDNTRKWADYQLTGDGTFAQSARYISVGTIEPVDDGKLPNNKDAANGLVWDEAGGEHQFFGLYPSPSWLDRTSKEDAEVAALPDGQKPSVAFSGGSSAAINAFLPKRQEKDDMRYAWMWAANKFTEGGTGEMNLDFYPMITTFHFTVGGSGEDGESLLINSVQLVSGSCALQGVFQATVTNPSASGGTATATYTTEAYSSTQNDTIIINLPPSTYITNSTTISFMAFVYPKGIAYDLSAQANKFRVETGQTAITDLTLRFKVSKNGDDMALSLPLKVNIDENYTVAQATSDNININSNHFVEFPAGKKINIKNITLPVQKNPWTFNVEGYDLIEEVSDIAVNPVAITKWEEIPRPGDLDESYVLDIVDERGNSLSNPSFSFTYAGGVKDLRVKSYKEDSGSAIGVDWKLQKSDDNGMTWIDVTASNMPQWIYNLPLSGTHSGKGDAALSYPVELMALALEASPNEHTLALRGFTSNGTKENPIDLSLKSLPTGNENQLKTRSDISRSTANCYVVDRPGWYKIPMVYGNAIKDGNVNTSAYEQVSVPSSYSTFGQFIRKGEFVDHTGNGILQPWVSQAYTIKHASLLWQDIPGLVTNVEMSGSGTDGYIVFYVDKATIHQGNAVLAAYTTEPGAAQQEVAWSWHIWVTDADFTPVRSKHPNPSKAFYYGIMQQDIGFSQGIEQRSYDVSKNRDVMFRIVQVEAGAEVGKKKEFTVAQSASKVIDDDNIGAYALLYQWGRKDPAFSDGSGQGGVVSRVVYTQNGIIQSFFTPNGGATKAYVTDYEELIKDPQKIFWANHPSHQTTNNVGVLRNPYHWNNNKDVYMAHYTDYAYNTMNIDFPVKTVYDPSPSGYSVPLTTVFIYSDSNYDNNASFWEFHDGKKSNGNCVLNGNEGRSLVIYDFLSANLNYTHWTGYLCSVSSTASYACVIQAYSTIGDTSLGADLICRPVFSNGGTSSSHFGGASCILQQLPVRPVMEGQVQ